MPATFDAIGHLDQHSTGDREVDEVETVVEPHDQIGRRQGVALLPPSPAGRSERDRTRPALDLAVVEEGVEQAPDGLLVQAETSRQPPAQLGFVGHLPLAIRLRTIHSSKGRSIVSSCSVSSFPRGPSRQVDVLPGERRCGGHGVPPEGCGSVVGRAVVGSASSASRHTLSSRAAGLPGPPIGASSSSCRAATVAMAASTVVRPDGVSESCTARVSPGWAERRTRPYAFEAGDELGHVGRLKPGHVGELALAGRDTRGDLPEQRRQHRIGRVGQTVRADGTVDPGPPAHREPPHQRAGRRAPSHSCHGNDATGRWSP